MSRIVLLAVNAKYIHSSLSVWVLAGGISKYSRTPYDVKVVEVTINQQNDEIINIVASLKPDVLGISAYIWNAHKLQFIMESLRERMPAIIIVLGGPEASHNSEYWLGHGADYVLRGEGEYSFPALLDALCDGRPISMESVEIITEPIDPYSQDFYDALDGRIAYLETSRGCPFKCAFCLSGGSGVRYFPLGTVKDQIKKLAQSSAKTVKLVDRTFNCNRDRAFILFEYIIELDTACCFHFEVAADLFDDLTLSLLSSAPPGRLQFEIGLQSYHEPALKASFRQSDLAKAERNIRILLQNQNIHIHIDLIAGLPYETLHDFRSGFDRAYELGTHTLQLGFLKLLHGSVLRKEADVMGLQYEKDPPYEITNSAWLSKEDLRLLKQTENALQHTYNKCRFLSTLEYVLSVSGLNPFSLFSRLGVAAPCHGMALDTYAGQIHDCFSELAGVDGDMLRDCMTYDWFCMVKGKNMPYFLKKPDARVKQVAKIAGEQLCRAISREQAAVLQSGRGIFIDDKDRDPVTRLYKVYVVDL